MTHRHSKTYWAELMQKYFEDAPSLRELIEERNTEILISVDTGLDGGSMVFGRKAVEGLIGKSPSIIIIDSIGDLEQDHFERIFKEYGVREKKPKTPSKQPDWARHNQAPRSFRRRK